LQKIIFPRSPGITLIILIKEVSINTLLKDVHTKYIIYDFKFIKGYNKKNYQMKIKVQGLNPNSNLVKEYKNSLKALTEVQKEASIGLILGDASLQTQNGGKTYRIKFEWGDRNKAYINHVHELYDEWILSEPHKKERISPNNNKVIN